MAVTIITTLNSREEWLEHRKNFIGGSDASAIVGLNPYMSNLELWQIKTGLMEQEDISEKPYAKYGTIAEEYLRELFKLDYPQYENSFSKTISKYTWEKLQEEAKRKLEEGVGVDKVQEHWQSIIDGVVPFGYEVE